MKCVIELKGDDFVLRGRKHPILARVPVETDNLAEVLRRTIRHVANGDVFDLLLNNVKVYHENGNRIYAALSEKGVFKICR